jgi:hypothetical protein
VSSELELLDQLCGGDETLFLALQVFGRPENSAALERARYSIMKQLSDGLIQIKHKAGGQEMLLPQWEAKQILGDDTNWMKRSGEAEYFISLTETGSKYISG